MGKDNNVKILNNYRRLKNIRRCNNFPTIQTENVAEHSFYVAITALTLADEYNRYVAVHNRDIHPLDVENLMEEVNTEKILKRALFHDMEECFTSDIPYNVKHFSPELNIEMRKCVKDTLNEVYKCATNSVLVHKYCIENCKDGFEGSFVALADLLEGAWYCYEEMQLGNSYVRGLMKNYLQEIYALEITEVLQKTCPTLDSTLKLFKSDFSFQPIREEIELFV